MVSAKFILTTRSKARYEYTLSYKIHSMLLEAMEVTNHAGLSTN